MQQHEVDQVRQRRQSRYENNKRHHEVSVDEQQTNDDIARQADGVLHAPVEQRRTARARAIVADALLSAIALAMRHGISHDHTFACREIRLRRRRRTLRQQHRE